MQGTKQGHAHRVRTLGPSPTLSLGRCTLGTMLTPRPDTTAGSCWRATGTTGLLEAHVPLGERAADNCFR